MDDPRRRDRARAGTLRFLSDATQSEARDATGFMGFFYHFLDIETGRRAIASELSTIDTTFLLAGALAAATYFDHDTRNELEIARLADALYRRVDWQWAQNGGLTVAHGWTPERGFLRYRWEGYNEAILLYVLGLGSPTIHRCRSRATRPGRGRTAGRSSTARSSCTPGRSLSTSCRISGSIFVASPTSTCASAGSTISKTAAGPRSRSSNTRSATRSTTTATGEHCWGLTASDGPGPASRRINGVKRRFYDYKARGIPGGPDDGTISPWAAVASLPFAPEIVLPTIRHFSEAHPQLVSDYGLRCSFNPTFRSGSRPGTGWHSQGYYGLEQGPIVLMIENYRSGFLWTLMKRCPYLLTGLRRAGFADGWLSAVAD